MRAADSRAAREGAGGFAVSLDGRWDFFPSARELADLDRLEPVSIEVPGLWEAQGHPDLDGAAWYRRRFRVDGVHGWWSLRFGAVMDLADVFLNGRHLGGHDGGFTPFELDATEALREGENVLAVRVVDPPLGDPDHASMPHGKQGWNNDAFPSRPSLYLTYGGIWQAVTLERHGAVVARDVFLDGNAGCLTVRLELVNRADVTQRAAVHVTTLGTEQRAHVELGPRERVPMLFELGPQAAARWSPERPVLHEARVAVTVDDEASDAQTVRYGLRTVRVEGRRVLVDDVPYRMKSVLVQGFRPEELYAEGDRDAIVEEVLAAKRMGFNTLRLHIKAFEPTYLDVCDEVGMFVHCDLPVAEPVDYAQLHGESVLARRCAEAAREQVRRDRNHPSVILWSAMNELGERRLSLRSGRDYASFVRAVVGAIEASDGTRPIIENDWIEFSGATVRVSRILTAHWYGRLHRDYFDKVDRKLGRWRDDGRVLLVTEYGDWGLPEMPELAEPPFWDTRARYAEAVRRAAWPDSVERFIAESQRYQGLSDRLQTEVFRRHDHLSGYCVTELTDVPHELNGLLDLHRKPKVAAVEEVTRANQPVLPMLDLRSFVVVAGERLAAALHVANDGPALSSVRVDVDGGIVFAGELPAHRATRLGSVTISTPAAPGGHVLAVRLAASGGVTAENRYELRVIARPRAAGTVQVVGGGRTAEVLRALGARSGDSGPTVVAEGALERPLRAELARRLERGETVLVLAQEAEAWRSYPVDLRLQRLDTRWASSAFAFTTGRHDFAALPEGAVLAGEDATVHARGVVTEIEGRPLPDEPLVVRYNPVGTTGWLIGVHGVGRGRIVLCQYRLVDEAAAGDAAARSLLTDLVRVAQRAHRPL